MYKIGYKRVNNPKVSKANKTIPSFCWKPTVSGSIPMPHHVTSTWKYHANSIFRKMVVQESIEPEPSDEIIDLTISPTVKTEKNDLASHSTSACTTSTGVQLDCCKHCHKEFDVLSANWKLLHCSHKLCNLCYKAVVVTRQTMKGQRESFVKCLFCFGVSGIEIGTCPDGTMKTSKINTPCAGYENHKTMEIHYEVKDRKYSLSRFAYLPANDEGDEVLKLLKIAWDRRLCFTIGTSVANGKTNVLVWNVEHKTSQQGGVQRFGFPDTKYMQRLRNELRAYGIE